MQTTSRQTSSRRIATTVIGAAVAATLITSGSVALASATPHPRISTDGLSEINLPPGLMSTLASGGVTLTAVAGAKSTINGSTGYTTVSLPVTKPVTDGLINNRGTLRFTGKATGVVLTLAKPTITFNADDTTTGTFGGILNGIPASLSPFDTILNGKFQAPFKLSNLQVTITQGTAKKRGANYFRTDAVAVTGDMSVTSNAEAVKVLNAALVGPTGTPVLTPGQSFGAVRSNFKVTVTCKVLKDCQAWSPEPE